MSIDVKLPNSQRSTTIKYKDIRCFHPYDCEISKEIDWEQAKKNNTTILTHTTYLMKNNWSIKWVQEQIIVNDKKKCTGSTIPTETFRNICVFVYTSYLYRWTALNLMLINIKRRNFFGVHTSYGYSILSIVVNIYKFHFFVGIFSLYKSLLLLLLL